MLAAWDASGLIVRPFVDQMQATVIDGVRHVTGGRLRAFVLTASDQRKGWPAPTIIATPDDELASAGASREQRRRRVWL